MKNTDCPNCSQLVLQETPICTSCDRPYKQTHYLAHRQTLLRVVIGMGLIWWLGGCSSTDSPLPPSQDVFIKSLKALQESYNKAGQSGNEVIVKEAESSITKFLRHTAHRADNWHATIESVENGEEIVVIALQRPQKFHIRIADPAVKTWAAKLQKGDEIEFSGNLGKEMSLTVSGGLYEPEFMFYPEAIRRKGEEAIQAQTQPNIKSEDLSVASEHYDLRVKSLIVKKVNGKHRYFFDIRNYDSKPFLGEVNIEMINNHDGMRNGDETFKSTQPIKKKLGTSVYVDINTGPVSVHGDWGIAKFKFAAKVDGKVVATGEDIISTKYEDLSR